MMSLAKPSNLKRFRIIIVMSLDADGGFTCFTGLTFKDSSLDCVVSFAAGFVNPGELFPPYLAIFKCLSIASGQFIFVPPDLIFSQYFIPFSGIPFLAIGNATSFTLCHQAAPAFWVAVVIQFWL
jgi:hypothetical protein